MIGLWSVNPSAWAQACQISSIVEDFENVNPVCLNGQNNAIEAIIAGCVPDWLSAAGTPDVYAVFPGTSISAYEADYYLGMVSANSTSCVHEVSVLDIADLTPGITYELTFWARTHQTGGRKTLTVNAIQSSGFSNVPNLGTPEPCITLPAGSQIVVQSTGFHSSTWTQFSGSFTANSANTQLLFYPIASADPTSNALWLFIDLIEITPCATELSPDFTTTTTGDPLSFTFMDATLTPSPAPDVVAWCWDFGDGSAVATTQNPTHTYAEEGAYEVCLTITDEEGCVGTFCQPLTVGAACECGEGFLFAMGNQTWDQNTVLSQHLVVPAGARLTIDAATLSIAGGCKIFVERGARLDVLNGSVLTAQCTENRWGGVEVWGNSNPGQGNLHPSLEQIGIGYPFDTDDHGVVYIENSTLERAGTAVSTNITGPYWPQGWGAHLGGIVVADGATFQLSGRCIELLQFPYQLLNPVEIPNVSRFDECTFIGLPGATEGIVTIFDCNEIAFIGNDFVGNGLRAVRGANFTATLKSNTFDDCYMAVEADYTDAMLSGDLIVGEIDVITSSNTFIDCSFGVVARECPQMEIGENQFSNTGVGNYLWGYSGYDIANNAFDGGIYGNILLNTSDGAGANKSQCNVYKGQAQAGSLAWGNNGNYEFIQETSQNGNVADLLMLPFSGVPGSIANSQGQINAPVFNLFGGDLNIVSATASGQTLPFTYYHPGPNVTTTYPALIPKCDQFLINCVGATANNFVNYSVDLSTDNYNDGCLNLPGIGANSPAPSAPCPDKACLTGLVVDEVAAVGLLDGGKTADLLDLIDQYPTASATYDSLLTYSPYLTDAVLTAYLAHGSPDQWRKEAIAQANAPLSYALMPLAEDELSTTVYQALETSRSTLKLSARDTLESELSVLRKQIARSVQSLTTAAFAQGNIAATDSVFMLVGDTERRVMLQAQAGNFTAAQSLLNGWSGDTDGVFLRQLDLDRRAAGPAYTLSATDSLDLESLAATAGPRQPLAQTLLGLLAGRQFVPDLPPTQVYLRAAVQQPTLEPAMDQASRRTQVYPNPANDFVEVVWPQHLRGPLTLELWSVQGQRVLSVVVDAEQRRYTLFIPSSLSNGMYWVRTSGGEWQSSVIVISR